MAELGPEQDPFNPEYDAPKEVPEEQSEEVRELSPSFRVVDKRKYFELINYKPHGRQWLYHESTARYKLPVCGRRFGKAVDLETELPSPDSFTGFVKMKDVQVGYRLFDANGKPCNVVAVSDVMYGNSCYLVVFNDGSTVIADAGHQWISHTKKYRKSHGPRRKPMSPEVVTTEEIKNTIFYGITNPEYNHCIPTAKAVEYQEADLQIDPYVLGAWLGDGTSNDATFTTADQEILDEIKKAGYQITKQAGIYRYNILGLWTQLKAEGQLKDKHIPIEYHTSSINQRLALLQGLMDTDGHASGASNEFCSMNNELAESVMQIALSLGFKTVMYTGQATLNGKNFGTKYRVFITGELPLYRLTRKLEKQFAKKRSNQSKYRAIVSVTRVESRPVKCVQVDSADHQYLATRSYIPTHNSMMVGKDIQTRLLIPNKRVWVVGPTYDLAEKEFRVVWDDMIVRLGFGREPRVKKAYNKKQGNMFIEFPWNTRIECRSAERPDTLVGESLDHVIMSEAAKHSRDTWDRYIQPSLSDRRGSADFGTTPEGMNWLYDLWQYGQDPGFLEFESWRYPSWENLVVYPGGREDAEILLLERTMPHDEFEQEIGALFTAFSGRIYSEFDEQTHVREVKYNPNWPNYIAFDWGFVNPLAAIEFQIDPMQRVHVWREHYKERVILEDHLHYLKHRPQPEGYKINLCFGDAADQGAVETVNAKFAPCWGDPKSKDIWMEGVQLVKSFLKPQQVGVIDEHGTPKYEPWLYVDHSCKNLIREFNNYRSVPRKSVRGVEQSPRETAQKFDDHALDALRYGMMHVFKLGANVRLSTTIRPTELVDVGSDAGFFTTDLNF